MVMGKIRESDSMNTAYIPIITHGNWEPNGVVTPTKAGDEYIDDLTGKKWYAQSTADTSWVEYNYTKDL